LSLLKSFATTGTTFYPSRHSLGKGNPEKAVSLQLKAMLGSPIPFFEAVSQFVIPAKRSEAEREPGSRSYRLYALFWIPDLLQQSFIRPE
jgi:hypothetical protein